MIILGIETSCDETAAALVQDGTKILSNVIASSKELHAKTGGIIPEVAAREQIKCILPVIEEAIHNPQSAIRKSCRVSRVACRDIDSLAVTVGPGLIGSLLVGVETSRTLACLWNKPIVPINHLKAHLYANFLRETSDQRPATSDQFPAVGLIVSGGHSDLILMKNHQSIKWLGGTRDDAVGECFDKCSRLLGLGYPGGPAIEACASKFNNRTIEQLNNQTIKLPRPMINQNNFDFSFSGLKTAVLNHIKHLKSMKQLARSVLPVGRQAGGWSNEIPTESRGSSTQSVGTIEQLAFQIQEAITDCLVTKTLKAAQKFQVKSILLGGGVAANSLLRKKLQVTSYKLQVKFFAPAKNLSTDNAAAIASCAYFNYQLVPWKKIRPDPGLGLA